MALRKEAANASGKTKIDAIRYDLDRLRKQIDGDRSPDGPTFTDQAPAWLKESVRDALRGIMAKTAPHNEPDPPGIASQA